MSREPSAANGALPLLPADIPGTVQQLLEESRQMAAAAGDGRWELGVGERGSPPDSQLPSPNPRLDRHVRQRLVDRGMSCAQSFGWNDTYTFTKALGEHMLIEHRGDLPTIILRPAIIESSLREPLPGWIDGLRMADPLIIAYGRRLLSVFPADPNIAVDFIPLDFVVNAVLGALTQAGKGGGLRIYQVATSSENPLPFRSLVAYAHDYFVRNPMRDRSGQPIQVRHWPFSPPEQFEKQLKRRHGQARQLTALLRKLPGTRRLVLRLAAAQSGLDRLEYFSRIYGPYARLNVQFDTTATRKLYESLPPEEQELFPFDVTRIDWRHYIQDVHIPGLRRNVLKLDEGEVRDGSAAATWAQPIATFVACALGKDPAVIQTWSRLEEDLGLDRSGILDLTEALQETFEVELEEEALSRAQTVGDLATIVAACSGSCPCGFRTAASSHWRRRLAADVPESSSLFQRTALQNLVRKVAWHLNRLVLRGWFRLRVEGADQLPAAGPFLIASNHTSHLDYAVLSAASGARPHLAYALGARDYFFNTPVRAALFHTLNVLPFDRRGNFVGDLQLCRRALELGHILMVFPEGTRSADGELLPFKPGVGMLALETGVPIVPAFIDGAFEALPRGSSFPRRRKLTVRFGPPIAMTPYEKRRGSVSNHRLYREIVDELRVRIEALRDRR